MGWSSGAVLVALAFGILFSMLYVSSLPLVSRHSRDVVPTRPQITQLQAIEIAEQHLRKEIPDLEEAWLNPGFYNYSSMVDSHRGPVAFSQIKDNPDPLRLALLFVHANGTQYFIDADKNSIISTHKPEPGCLHCSPIGLPANAAKDRLVYMFEVAGWHPSPPTVPSPFGSYIIDAESGEIVWNSIDWERNRHPSPRVDIYDNASNGRTIRELLLDRLDPFEKFTVFISEEAASGENNGQYFVSNVARAIMEINNIVQWENKDIVSHTVKSDIGYANSYTGKFDSGEIPPGAKYEYTFIEIGKYSYHCEIHPWMSGTVEIVESYA